MILQITRQWIGGYDSAQIDMKTSYVFTAETRNASDYVKHRLEYKLNVYTRLANRSKWFYYIVATCSLVSAALVPVLILKQEYKDWATGLSLIVTILIGIQRIFHPREHWRNYDMISAMLRREEMAYSTKSGDYAKIADSDRLNLLVNRIEKLITQEREETIIMRTTDFRESETETRVQSASDKG